MLHKFITISFIIGSLSCPSWLYATTHTTQPSAQVSKKQSRGSKIHFIIAVSVIAITTGGYLMMRSGDSQEVEYDGNSFSENLSGKDSSDSKMQDEDDFFGQNLSDKDCLHITREQVDKLYEENKDKIEIKKNEDVGIDDTKMEQWVQKMIGHGYRKFAKELQKKTRFISFKELHKKIEQLSQEMIEIMKKKNAYNDILFAVSGDIKKSNTWIFLLFWGCIKDSIPKDKKCKFISSKKEELGQFIINAFPTKQNPLIFTFDDMSYSAQQLGFEFADIRMSNAKYKNFYMVLPYITKKAKDHLTSITKKFMKSMEVIETINCETVYYKGVDVQQRTLVPVIFEHKVADNLSVPQTIYLIAAYPFDPKNSKKELQKYTPTSLLKGVKPFSKAQQKKIKEMHYLKGKKKYILDNFFIPPTAYYKSINYSYKGSSIQEGSIFEAMYSIQKQQS